MLEHKFRRETIAGQVPVVAIDIAGAERGFPAVVHKEAFALAHGLCFDKTVHAGEGFGPESIHQAAPRECHLSRLCSFVKNH